MFVMYHGLKSNQFMESIDDGQSYKFRDHFFSFSLLIFHVSIRSKQEEKAQENFLLIYVYHIDVIIFLHSFCFSETFPQSNLRLILFPCLISSLTFWKCWAKISTGTKRIYWPNPFEINIRARYYCKSITFSMSFASEPFSKKDGTRCSTENRWHFSPPEGGIFRRGLLCR